MERASELADQANPFRTIKRDPERANRSSLVQLKRSDRVHHPLAEAGIHLAFAALEVGFGKIKRLANDNRDRMKRNLPLPRGSASCAPKMRIGTTGARVFAMTKPSAGLGRLQIAIKGAGAFGKNQRAMVRSQNPDQRLERAAIAAFLVNRNDVKLRQKPAEHRKIEKRLAREKINRAPTTRSRQAADRDNFGDSSPE